MSARRAAALALEQIGLQRPAFRAWEWAQVARAWPERLAGGPRESDGLPLPPGLLRVQVTGAARADEFLAQSARAADTVRRAAGEAGRDIAGFDAVLDFGCGCGRVMRRWATVSGPRFYGCDYNPKLVEWCQRNLTFAEFAVNGLAPPLPYADRAFDFVYALSVFTHLTEPLQHAWMDELRRIIRPGGLLVFTTRGDAWSWKLTAAERARYDAGRLVTRYEEVSGTNLCAVFHPLAYVHERMFDGFRLVNSLDAALADGAQDIHTAERTA
jgi:SAM-dependent methyltransferase